MKCSIILIAAFASASLAGPTTNAQRQNIPTRDELCKPFNGNDNACTDAIRECLQKAGRDPERTQTCVHAAAEGGVDEDKQQKDQQQEDQQPQKPGSGERCTLGPNNCADGLECVNIPTVTTGICINWKEKDRGRPVVSQSVTNANGKKPFLKGTG
ncbi:hypothetical protein NHJ6243_010245, partial [Beauveria neobassiana]